MSGNQLINDKSIEKYISFDPGLRSFVAYKNSLFGKQIIAKGKYKDIIDIEIVEDGETILKGGLGHAVIGGVVFGGAGAIAGAIIGRNKKAYCDRILVNITMVTSPSLISIPIIDGRIAKNSSVYKNAIEISKKIVSKIKSVCSQVGIGEAQVNQQPKIDEYEIIELLEKYKRLLDSGVITQEEYDKKKSELLE